MPTLRNISYDFPIVFMKNKIWESRSRSEALNCQNASRNRDLKQVQVETRTKSNQISLVTINTSLTCININKTGLQPVSRSVEWVHYFGGWVEGANLFVPRPCRQTRRCQMHNNGHKSLQNPTDKQTKLAVQSAAIHL